MHTFTDTAGRTWELSLTIGKARRLKDRLGVDLLRLSEPIASGPLAMPELTLAARLVSEMDLPADVADALIESQERGVTASLDGAAFERMREALLAELDDFFRQPWPELAALLLGTKRMADRCRRELSTFGSTLTSSLGPAESIPTPSATGGCAGGTQGPCVPDGTPSPA